MNSAPSSAIRRACAVSRPARLRQAAGRRAPLEPSLRKIADHIVDYLRQCLTAEPEPPIARWWWNKVSSANFTNCREWKIGGVSVLAGGNLFVKIRVIRG
jgi:hypothetical protein